MDSTLLVKVIVTSVRAKPQGLNSIMQKKKKKKKKPSHVSIQHE